MTCVNGRGHREVTRCQLSVFVNHFFERFVVENFALSASTLEAKSTLALSAVFACTVFEIAMVDSLWLNE